VISGVFGIGFVLRLPWKTIFRLLISIEWLDDTKVLGWFIDMFTVPKGRVLTFTFRFDVSFILGTYHYTPVYPTNILWISCSTCRHIRHPCLHLGLLPGNQTAPKSRKYCTKYYLLTALTRPWRKSWSLAFPRIFNYTKTKREIRIFHSNPPIPVFFSAPAHRPRCNERNLKTARKATWFSN